VKLIRYRRPSVNQLRGISRAKSRFTRATGGRVLRHPQALRQNFERRVKRRMGYYSWPAKAMRARHLWLGPFKLW
jgi:hypothetical protein